MLTIRQKLFFNYGTWREIFAIFNRLEFIIKSYIIKIANAGYFVSNI